MTEHVPPKKIPIILISKDEELTALRVEQEEGNARIVEFEKKVVSEGKALWVRIEARLKELDVYPSDYSKEKYFLECEDGVIFAVEKDSKPNIEKIIKEIFDGK